VNKSIWLAQFDPDADYEVVRPFRFAGESFEKGEIFDFKTSTRQLRILYESRHIRLVVPVERVAVPAPASVPLAPVSADPDDGPAEPVLDGVEDPVDPESTETPNDDPAPVTISPKGGGWYDVLDPNGAVLNDRPLRIADAEHMVKEIADGVDVRRRPGE